MKRRTVKENTESLIRALKRIQEQQISEGGRLVDRAKIEAIDLALLTALRAKLVEVPDWIAGSDLGTLRLLYKYAGEGSVFVGVSIGDFPKLGTGKSLEDLMRSRIVAQALTRSAQIAVFKSIEDGFQNLEIDLSLYAFWNLAHHLFVRPESYRQIKCGDLKVNGRQAGAEVTYTLLIRPAKRKGLKPKPMPYELDERLGELLMLHRQRLIEEAGPRYGINAETSLEEREKVERRLALFPRRTGEVTEFEKRNYGMLVSGHHLSNSYVRPLQSRLNAIKIGFNVMRHTIATHLAAAGCSAQTIQAVLKHATDQTARTYVDLATKELKDRLNQGLEGLPELFPAYSAFTTQAAARIIPIRAINSSEIDSKSGRLKETTPGLCGGRAACDYAPLACYGCWRFIPAIDADHTMNYELVLESISRHRALGRAFVHLLDRDEILRVNIEFVMAQCAKQRQAEAEGAV
jgi:integrase